MKPATTRVPLRLRGTLLALAVAAMATQVSGASAAAQMSGARPGAPVAAVALAPLPAGGTQLPGLASLLPGPPVSGSGGLIIASLIGAWAIARRRMSVVDSRSLDPHRLRRR